MLQHHVRSFMMARTKTHFWFNNNFVIYFFFFMKWSSYNASIINFNGVKVFFPLRIPILLFNYFRFPTEFRILEAKSTKAHIFKVEDTVYFQNENLGIYRIENGEKALVISNAVSYTHLTLPTILLV